MDILNGKRLILGSKSPRRKQLLTEGGFTFECRIQDIEETFDPDMDVYKVAEDLAIRKAAALEHTLSLDEILLTADSVVIADEKIYNKPDNYKHAIEILSALSNKTHTVATGVCIKSTVKSQSFTVITNITFDPITTEEMDFYLTGYKPYDKAGSYGIQDWIGLCKVNRIEGSYSNVMGLPVREVYHALLCF